ncbi:uncharacterized protein LOC111288872 [Durio zibethinus]|uniref:Uncharacterized protein LOC111288872 n=1 Tax=Durio zibethinus TaxID=66656 RepID=A0A6P5Y545_DURZI|nr:uncharacterized protein LOC111288872 [Durio zibethinus]
MSNILKFNVDGSKRGKPGTAGCGGALRDSKSNIRRLFCGPLGIQDSNMAGCKKKTSELFKTSQSYKKEALIIESDSIVTISWIYNRGNRPWGLWSTLDEINSLKKSIGMVGFVLAFREANSFADALVKLGVNSNEFFVAWL